MPGKLRTTPELDNPDAFYEALIALHDGLDAEQSRLADAELVLVLANHIGDRDVLDEAITLVRKTLS
jgi:hypothetical protein